MQTAAWLGVACLGLLLLSPLSAQELKLRYTRTGHAIGVSSVTFSPDGKTLASAGGVDNTIELWDLPSGN